jgi:hypothetical protein
MTTTISPVSETEPAHDSAVDAPDWPNWVNASPRLTGRQEPADESWFAGDESAGDRAANLGARAGIRPLPWQWIALRKILSRRDDGLFTHPDALLIATRQSGKSEVISLRILFGLFVLDEQIVYSSQRFITAESIWKRLKAIIERRPSLHARLAKDPTCSSSRAVIELKSGARVALGLRSGDLGKGLDSVDLVVFDEAYNLTEVEVSALAGSQLASPNSRTIYTSTPPVQDEHPNCHVLAGLRRLGQARQPDLYFGEWRAPEGLDRGDPETWRFASPSYGVIQKERDVQRLYSKATTPTAQKLFDADYLGRGDYPRDAAEVKPPIPAEVWDGMAVDDDDEPELVGPYAVAVDRSPDRSTWAIAAARRRADGRIHVEIGYSQSATNGEVVDEIIRVVTEFDPVALVLDQRSAAAPIRPLLEQAGIEPTLLNASQLAVSCGGVSGTTLSQASYPIPANRFSTTPSPPP